MKPDDLRVSNHGARWYHDPLPACPVASATDDRWPAVSTVKKAWDKPYRKKTPGGELVKYDAYQCAEYAVAHPELFGSLTDKAEAFEAIATAGGRALTKAADRGTSVHTVLEDLATPGVVVDENFVPDDARPYVAACRAFVADCKPTFVLSEFVVFNRGVGFAGTGDAIIIIDGTTYLVDWKSRGGRHGAYEEEAAQIGGYSMAEYVIGAEGVRFRLPPIDAGLIVSITADDGYQLHPIDLVKAGEAFLDMRECWARHRDGTATARKAIGRPMVLTSDFSTSDEGTEPMVAQAVEPPMVEPTLDELDRRQTSWLRERIVVMRDSYPAALDDLASRWPAGVPTLKQGGHTTEQIEAITSAVYAVESAYSIPF